MAAAKIDRALLDAEAKKSAADYLSWRSGDPAQRWQELAKAFLGERLQTRALIDRLERRCADLEAKLAEHRGISYQGTWTADADYAAGNFVTHGGSVWHAELASKGLRPGTCAAWKLAVKRGARR